MRRALTEKPPVILISIDALVRDAVVIRHAWSHCQEGSKKPAVLSPRGFSATLLRYYCTFNAKSSTTNDVCAELSSAPTR